LGRLDFELALPQGRFLARAKVETSGVAAIFDDTRIVAESGGVRLPAGLAWAQYDLDHAYAEKRRTVAMRRAGLSVTTEIAPRFGDMGAPPATANQMGSAFDPVSAFASLSIGVAAAKACAVRLPVFDGRQYYRLTLRPARREPISTPVHRGSALVCSLAYEPIAGFKPMSADERRRIPEAQVWFADPATARFPFILRVEVPTPIGPVRLDAVSSETRTL
jgi:hypothetical protein